MKRAVLAAFAIVGIGLAIYVWKHGDATPASNATGTASKSAPSSTPSPTPSTSRTNPADRRVRKLTPEARAKLAAEIAAARQRRHAASKPSAAPSTGGDTPALPDETIALEQVGDTLKAALAEAIPLLADCYPADDQRRTAAVTMVMTSEPDVATVIDTSELRDEHGQPLPRELDDCLRTTIESLALPPLPQGGKLPLQYSFVFD